MKSNPLVNTVILVFWLVFAYLSLFQQDTQANVVFIKNLGPIAVILTDIVLVFVVAVSSLKMMDLITGSRGLERIKKIYGVLFLGGASLGFAFEQFFNAVATSSAEGGTVIVEVWRQLAQFFETGHIESYGLVGMLTSNASGPWNHSIFPLIIIGFYLFKNKSVSLDSKELHIPMVFMTVLYAQQFFFALDNQYSFLEIILMLSVTTLFAVGMFSFLLPLFKEASANENAVEGQADPEKNDWSPLALLAPVTKRYHQILDWFSKRSFQVITWHPKNKTVSRYLHPNKPTYKHERPGHWYFLTNTIQLVLAVSLAMFGLTFSMQFLFAQFGMSDAEAALFGTAGATSAPEMFVASAAGPYISVLLFVGSNVIDGWFSAIGQFCLAIVVSITNGQLALIPLAGSIRYLTFLSFSQGIFVWLSMFIYARLHKHYAANYRLIMYLFAGALSIANLYYFGFAWICAQALGAGTRYATNSPIFITISKIIAWLSTNHAQTLFLYLNLASIVPVSWLLWKKRVTTN